MPNPFLKAYEFEKQYKIDRLKLKIEKAELAYKTHEPETLDYCKCIIESVSKKILTEKGAEIDKNWKLSKLVKETLNSLSLEDNNVRKAITNIVEAYADIRNNRGIAGHGHIEVGTIPSSIEVDIFVSTFSNFIAIVTTLLNNKPIDILNTSMDFKILERRLNIEMQHQYLDRNADVQYDEEEGVIFIAGTEVRPSEILYHFDRLTYKERLESSSQDLELDNISETLEQLVSEELCDNRFDFFYPGHYGYELPEININEMERYNNILVADGTIDTIARLGSSSDEHSIGVNYSSGFKAKFTYDYDTSENSFNFEIEELQLEKSDWIEPDHNEAIISAEESEF